MDRISTGTLQNVFANMIRRVHLCEERNGGTFSARVIRKWHNNKKIKFMLHFSMGCGTF
jgi:hypothetical protein